MPGAVTNSDTAGEVTLAVDEGGKGTENGTDLGCFEAPPDFASSINSAEEPIPWTGQHYATNPSAVHLLLYAIGDR